MNLVDYQKQAIVTKIYDDSVAIPYIVLGICGEAAELYEKMTELDIFKPKTNDLLEKEIGDVSWYLAGWAEENGLQLEDIVMLGTIPTMDIDKSIYEVMNDIVIYSGQIAEFAKKALRDDFADISKGKYPESKMLKTNIAAANLYASLLNVCYVLEIDMAKVLQQNVDKLKARAEKGKLQGSGDER